MRIYGILSKFIPMKSIAISFALIIGMACDTVKDLPDNNSNNTSQKETVESSDTALPNQEAGIPGRITFKAKVKETFDSDKSICGVSRSNVLQVEVIEILEGGSGITNMPHKKDVLLVNFLLASKELGLGNIIEAKAKESLCPDASKTYFTVNSYEILE